MKLAVKQITLQLLKNKVFILLMFVLMGLTSLSYFFVMFSVDGNMAVLKNLQALSDNQILLKDALSYNSSLVYKFLVALIALTIFVIIMFFYRFFRANKKMLGGLKALGFKNYTFQWTFTLFISVIAVLGAFLGMLGGYYLSSVLMDTYIQSYAVTGLVKGISVHSCIIGILITSVLFSLTANLTYLSIANKDAGALIASENKKVKGLSVVTLADKISNIIPTKNKIATRISLRKPIAIVLILVAVMSFSVCVILGQSLHLSNQKILDSQTIDHNYEYNVQYVNPVSNIQENDNALHYIQSNAEVEYKSSIMDKYMISLYSQSPIFTLLDKKNEVIELPQSGNVIIGEDLKEIYGVNIGDTIALSYNDKKVNLTVSAIAVNAKTNSIYMNIQQMINLTELSYGYYNGALYLNYPNDLPTGATVISTEQKIDTLNRNATSNKVSAVINQVTGAVVGCILIFLALYINFQDNTRDILILNMTGYNKKQISKMLINIYLPMLWISFVITLLPSILLAKEIQRSLSITINDYMPFGTSVIVIIYTFVIVNIIYWLVQNIFSVGIKRVIKKEDVFNYLADE